MVKVNVNDGEGENDGSVVTSMAVGTAEEPFVIEGKGDTADVITLRDDGFTLLAVSFGVRNTFLVVVAAAVNETADDVGVIVTFCTGVSEEAADSVEKFFSGVGYSSARTEKQKHKNKNNEYLGRSERKS